MEKSYKEIEFYFGDIEKAVEELKKHNEQGKKVFITFNGEKLYSDIDDVDSAYKKVTGKTKAEFDEAERIRSEEYKSKNKNGSNNSIPAKYELSQNHPNPFNPTTSIMYSIPKDGFVSLKIYDITGREIKTLVNEIKKAGYYSITLNASELSTGIYFYRVQTGNFFQTKRMVLIK